LLFKFQTWTLENVKQPVSLLCFNNLNNRVGGLQHGKQTSLIYGSLCFEVYFALGFHTHKLDFASENTPRHKVPIRYLFEDKPS
jgi:hypothetical protein